MSFGASYASRSFVECCASERTTAATTVQSCSQRTGAHTHGRDGVRTEDIYREITHRSRHISLPVLIDIHGQLDPAP